MLPQCSKSTKWVSPLLTRVLTSKGFWVIAMSVGNPPQRQAVTGLSGLQPGIKVSEGNTHFKFNKYSDRYLDEIAYRFNRRFNLKTLPQRLLVAGLACPPFPERLLRSAELCC
jgi:hypothetical protein